MQSFRTNDETVNSFCHRYWTWIKTKAVLQLGFVTMFILLPMSIRYVMCIVQPDASIQQCNYEVISLL